MNSLGVTTIPVDIDYSIARSTLKFNDMIFVPRPTLRHRKNFGDYPLLSKSQTSIEFCRLNSRLSIELQLLVGHPGNIIRLGVQTDNLHTQILIPVDSSLLTLFQ